MSIMRTPEIFFQKEGETLGKVIEQEKEYVEK